MHAENMYKCTCFLLRSVASSLLPARLVMACTTYSDMSTACFLISWEGAPGRFQEKFCCVHTASKGGRINRICEDVWACLTMTNTGLLVLVPPGTPHGLMRQPPEASVRPPQECQTGTANTTALASPLTPEASLVVFRSVTNALDDSKGVSATAEP